MSTSQPGVLSREFLPASIAIFATAALASFQALGLAAALPDIADDLGNVSLLPWVITAFLVTSSLATVVSGPFLDALGVSRVFRAAVVIFATTGFATAFAPSMEALVALRALQGVGAGLILSAGNTAVALVYPQNLVGRAFAARTTVWGVMAVGGPAIAATMLTFLSWEWILYVNLPMGAIALAAGWRVMPGPFGQSGARFDPMGSVLLAVATIATLVAVDSLDVRSLIWLLVVVLAVATYAWHARRAPLPVVKLEHIVPQPYRGLALSCGLILTGTFAMSSYIPLYVRAGLNGSAGLTAWSVLPLSVGWTVGAITSSRMADRHSESWIILIGFMVNLPAMALAWFFVVVNAPLIATFLPFVGAGVGVGMATNAAFTLLRAVTDPASMGRVGSAYLFVRNQGFTFGAAIGGAVLLFVVASKLGDVELVREMIGSSDVIAPQGGPEAVRSGFAASIAVGVILSALGSLAAIALHRSLSAARTGLSGIAGSVP